MPMYEKGSVRAEPRSKQQERMKKIMKKFLSSLLALTMILSLVIVPANATEPDDSSSAKYQVTGTVTVSANKTNVNGGKEVTFTADTTGLTVKKQKEASSSGRDPQSDEPAVEWETVTSGVTWGYSWKVDSGSAESEATTDTFKKTFDKPNNSQDAKHTVSCTVTLKINNEEIASNSITVPENSSLTGSKEITVKAPAVTIKANGTAIADSSTAVEILKGGKLELTAETAGINNPSYRWTVSSDVKSTSSTYSVSTTSKTGSDVTVTCNVYEGEYDSTSNSNPAATATCKYKVVEEDLRWNVSPTSKSVTLTKKGATAPVTATLEKKAAGGTWNSVSSQTYSFELSKSGVASLSNQNTSAGSVTVTLQNEGDVTLTVSTMYKGAKQSVDIKVSGELLSASLKEVTNGDELDFDYSDLETLANKVLPRGVDVKRGGYITIENYPTKASEGGTLYVDSTKYTGTRISLNSNADLTFKSQAGFIGDANLELTVTGDDNQSYTVYVTIPVTSAGEIKDTATGTSANKEVTFTNDDYDYLYYSYTKPTYKDYFDGNKVSDFEGPVKEDKTVTVPASKFNSSKTVTLYVVGLDSKGVASTGTITVSQKSYDINYNVVAGKSVSFSQKDFEDFLEDYAEDNGNYNPKKDEITFDHATLNSLPTAKSEGTLYYGGSEVTSTSNRKAEYTDMDKMTFEAVAKPTKDTVTLTFRVYGEIEKPNSRKPDKVNYDVNVVISVVKEDITYTVGIDDTVQLTARDFVNFLQDARTSYRKAELDYVKFDVSGKNVSSYAYGGLYRSYSSYSTGKLADSTDKFYYEPSRTQYDLADVAYHTTRWAEAGKTVYIPFTVYGTKGEEASGTMAITIAQTMNFIDVKASDFFYEPVKWAVNNKITNGTSSTTFSPYKNCNRAEIVTFLWRAAGSPEPTVTRNPFTDVNSVRDASYYKAILWASQKGITAGTNATTFSPYQECTRSQIVTFLYRYAGKPSGYYSNPFKDVSSVNEASYYNAILWAVGKGITQGTSTTTFSPYASCTRGEAVTFLYRYVNGVK